MNTFQIFGTSLLGLLPAIIAWVRGHPKRWWILLLALSSGLLGPIICLIAHGIKDFRLGFEEAWAKYWQSRKDNSVRRQPLL
jgi:hypothetical protein